MDKMPCIPVKITDKQWADSLQDGSVFMRSLHHYGSWSIVERTQAGDQQMKSGVQGDVGEGIVRRVDPKIGDEYFNRFDPKVRALMQDCFYIDENIFQYCKVFCMYGLTYMIPEKRYQKPDERIREFGDTAVIILNPNEFLKRVLQAPDYYGPLDEFCKSVSFAWQNEMRMRVALLNPESKKLIQNTDNITVNIGDIRDISVQIPVEDLIQLKLPDPIQNPQFTLR